MTALMRCRSIAGRLLALRPLWAGALLALAAAVMLGACAAPPVPPLATPYVATPTPLPPTPTSFLVTSTPLPTTTPVATPALATPTLAALP